jgi:ADP-ribose pyrophosphatase YjhB (NUDIX family)
MDNALKKHFTASAVIINEGKILLVYHKKLDVWLYPGGHVEENETPDEAVVREVMEETGLAVEIIGEKDNNLADTSADVSVLHQPYVLLCELVGNHYHNDMVYLCKIKGGAELKHDPRESEAIKFFCLSELDGIKLFPNFKALLIKIFSRIKQKS